MSKSFTEQVVRVVQAIPAGQTMTYQQVARQAGRPGAGRAVGSILHAIWQSDRGRTVPCHRVIRSDGQLGGYAGGTNEKRRRLEAEQMAASSGSVQYV